MMKLLSSLLSPYVRKVRLTAAMKGLTDKIEMVASDTNPGDKVEINSVNPLGKIPALVVDGHPVIYDSHVICEYLDSLTPSPVLFPRSGPERWATLSLGSLADGVLDAALLLVYEKRFRPEAIQHAPWQARQQAKIDRALGMLEQSPPGWGQHPDYGHLTLACALGYLDFRHEGKWRPAHPALIGWLDRFAAAVPAFEATRPKA
jgi:glutathione S-transferase